MWLQVPYKLFLFISEKFSLLWWSVLSVTLSEHKTSCLIELMILVYQYTCDKISMHMDLWTWGRFGDLALWHVRKRDKIHTLTKQEVDSGEEWEFVKKYIM